MTEDLSKLKTDKLVAEATDEIIDIFAKKEYTGDDVFSVLVTLIITCIRKINDPKIVVKVLNEILISAITADPYLRKEFGSFLDATLDELRGKMKDSIVH